MRALRIDEMERFIRKNGVVSLETLGEHFNVSLNTIRRDIASLVERGVVEKVFGGVRLAPYKQTPFQIRDALLSDEKLSIGMAAADFIEPNDVVYIGPGTTPMQVLEGIKDQQDITVITNNLRVMERACAMENIALIALPGQLHHRNISFNGSDQAVFFDRYNVRTAFMPAAGISLSRGITYGSTVEADFARHVLARCPLRVLMVDHTKFDVVGLTTMADFNSIDVLVTDEPPGEAYVEALSRAHVRLVVANKIRRE